MNTTSVKFWGLATGLEASTGDFASAIVDRREVIGLMAEDDEGAFFVSFVDLAEDETAPTIIPLHNLYTAPLKIQAPVIVQMYAPFASKIVERSSGRLAVAPDGDVAVFVHYTTFGRGFLTAVSLTTGLLARATQQWRVFDGWSLLVQPEGRTEPYVVASFPKK